MREIKFRYLLKGWKKRKNIEWLYITLIGAFDTARGWAEEIDIETIGQYTGLKDKNGIEIYEGDIVDYISENCLSKKYKYRQTVKWSNEGFCDGELGYRMGVGFEISWDEDEEREVIGNIWENPELLKK